MNYTQEDASHTAIVRALLKHQGTPIGSYDILLAGTAVNHNLIFVSANLKELSRVKGLIFENWRE